jgi:transposase
MMFFTPTPELTLTTGDARVGTVDFVQEFGIEQETFREFRTVAKVARKHKIRYARMSFDYDQDAQLQRTITFQNVSFPVTAAANATSSGASIASGTSGTSSAGRTASSAWSPS